MASLTLNIPDGRRVAGLADARAFINANSPPDPVSQPNQTPYVQQHEDGSWFFPTDLSYANWVMDNACTSYANAFGEPADPS